MTPREKAAKVDTLWREEIESELMSYDFPVSGRPVFVFNFSIFWELLLDLVHTNVSVCAFSRFAPATNDKHGPGTTCGAIESRQTSHVTGEFVCLGGWKRT